MKKLKPFLKKKFLAFIEQKDSFFTYHLRPKYAKNFNLWSDKIKNESKTAIIIQGPIVKDYDFTLETIKIYKKLFQEQIIILSIWEDEDMGEIAKIKQEGVEVILNKRPAFYGQQNINLQIVSSFAGAKRAKDLGAEYAIKTRTDQRIYAPNSLDFLRNILEVFPLRGDSVQKKRIVGVSLNSYKYRPYGLSDMTIYGQIDDFILYWSIKLDGRIFPNETLIHTMGEFANARICEAYLVTEFVKKLGHTPKTTIADSWDVFAKYFCVVDQISLDLYWYKYTRHIEHKTLEYKSILSSQTMTFSEWLNLYVNLDNKVVVPEIMLKKQFGSIIHR